MKKLLGEVLKPHEHAHRAAGSEPAAAAAAAAEASHAKTNFERIDKGELVEEERYQWYETAGFYPVTIGETLHDHYKVLGKLGHGTASTVWLCRDLRDHKFVSVKVFVQRTTQGQTELKVHDHISKIVSKHAGKQHIVALHDRFHMQASSNSNLAIVYEPLCVTLEQIRLSFHTLEQHVDLGLIRVILHDILMGLDFLHTEAHTVHTDLYEANVMIGSDDDTPFREFEEAEQHHPSARKIDGKHTIYRSRPFSMPDEPGLSKIIDFGEARFGAREYSTHIMPDFCRAPEVCLQIPWNEKVDIWSLGILVWQQVEGTLLFDETHKTQDGTDILIIARAIGLMGPIPDDVRQKSPIIHELLDQDGHWKLNVKIPRKSFEQEASRLQGHEKTLFLAFIRKMLQWRPEDRLSARELMRDPWLMSN